MVGKSQKHLHVLAGLQEEMNRKGDNKENHCPQGWKNQLVLPKEQELRPSALRAFLKACLLGQTISQTKESPLWQSILLGVLPCHPSLLFQTSLGTFKLSFKMGEKEVGWATQTDSNAIKKGTWGVVTAQGTD